ncbi:hypothetical protein SGGMMB4_02214 [Sodalis glossinidius str. 'morsitans']|uniref:Uncharacterized protein n=1 Tax=Sodalis glossinidius (strain morsitans) TaxID=343509 RepID=A0A193QI50_SODGM|nr:hypothetical protein [Sodalis glossinidius]CRL44857.1 hypothetical protein SGGMMB4_02214 [Sodalis glossinidius str. 'morsitans']
MPIVFLMLNCNILHNGGCGFQKLNIQADLPYYKNAALSRLFGVDPKGWHPLSLNSSRANTNWKVWKKLKTIAMGCPSMRFSKGAPNDHC